MSTSSVETMIPSPELDTVSTENIVQIKNAYVQASVEIGQFSTTDDAESMLAQHETAARTENRVTINMSTNSIEHLLKQGKIETFWDAKTYDAAAQVTPLHTNNKAIHSEYEQMRAAADNGYRKYAPHDAKRADPIYGALATALDVCGAAPAYGNCWVVVSDVIADRAVYGFADSHASVTRNEDGELQHDSSTVLNRHDAITAKAVTELVAAQIKSLNLLLVASNLAVMGANEEKPKIIEVNGLTPGYVEAAIFDPIELDDIAEIHVAMTDRKTMHDVGVLLRTNQAFAQKAQLEDRPTTSQLVDDWLAIRRHQLPAGEPKYTSQLWERLGLTPSSDMATVAQSLKQTGSVLLRDISRITYRQGDIRLVDFSNEARWHNYLRNVRATGKYLSDEKQPQLQGLLADFIAVQEARVFFNSDEALL